MEITANVQQPFSTQQLLDSLLCRVKAEYLEMPGMSLSPEQAARLFGMTPEVCSSLLDVLTVTQFLCKNARGQYVRPQSR
jgi:hypothetical protein